MITRGAARAGRGSGGASGRSALAAVIPPAASRQPARPKVTSVSGRKNATTKRVTLTLRAGHRAIASSGNKGFSSDPWI